jgi:hypothetical protein
MATALRLNSNRELGSIDIYTPNVHKTHWLAGSHNRRLFATLFLPAAYLPDLNHCASSKSKITSIIIVTGAFILSNS